VNELAKWSNTERIKNLIHICGSNDKLIPPTIRSCSHLIEGGEHFMIVDKAEEISQINKGYTSCGASVDGRLFVQEYVRSSCVSGHRFVNLVHKHSYGFVHPKPNTFVPN
jgi:hypothetical protein